MNNNTHFKTPKTFFIGQTEANLEGLPSYLAWTGNLSFFNEINEAQKSGLSDGEILCSFYAKLCYASLTTEHNENITKIRSIADNLMGTIESQHGSIFSHVMLNFVVSDCSRIFTHEMVRHGVGTAFSQESGRYVRKSSLDLVIDPCLAPVAEEIEEIRSYLETRYNGLVERLRLTQNMPFSQKKKLTSALRRILPNGQTNEFGFSINLRALRHVIELRTSHHAEWEIRLIFNQVFDLVKEKYPMIFFDAQVKEIEGLNEITFINKKI